MSALLIAMDSPLKLHGLLEVVSGTTELRSVTTVRDSRAALRELRDRTPDILLVDAAIGREIHGALPATQRLPRTMILGAQRHAGLCPGRRPNPACGFAGERATTDQLREALRYLAACPRPSVEREACLGCPVRSSLRLPVLPLSRREAQIFERIARGEGVKSMATAFGISVKTVEHHRASIKRKLGLATAHDLLRAALQWEQGEFEPSPRVD